MIFSVDTVEMLTTPWCSSHVGRARKASLPARSLNRTKLSKQYREALEAFLVHGEAESALFRAYELGRQAIAQKLSDVALIPIHHQATVSLAVVSISYENMR